MSIFRMSIKPEKSVESIEKMRLDCFCNMLHSLGFTTSIDWVKTKYFLSIKRGMWPFLKLVQVLEHETGSSEAPVQDPWHIPANIFAQGAMAALYRNALQQVLSALSISLGITEEVEYALHNFPRNIAYALHAFPVQYIQEDKDDAIFWVVSPKVFTENDLQFARCVWGAPIELRRVNSVEGLHIPNYLNLFFEWYLSPPYSLCKIMKC